MMSKNWDTIRSSGALGLVEENTPWPRHQAKGACRPATKGSNLERRVRPHTTAAPFQSCSYVACTPANASVICTKVVGVFFAPSLKEAPD